MTKGWLAMAIGAVVLGLTSSATAQERVQVRGVLTPLGFVHDGRDSYQLSRTQRRQFDGLRGVEVSYEGYLLSGSRNTPAGQRVRRLVVTSVHLEGAPVRRKVAAKQPSRSWTEQALDLPPARRGALQHLEREAEEEAAPWPAAPGESLSFLDPNRIEGVLEDGLAEDGFREIANAWHRLDDEDQAFARRHLEALPGREGGISGSAFTAALDAKTWDAFLLLGGNGVPHEVRDLDMPNLADVLAAGISEETFGALNEAYGELSPHWQRAVGERLRRGSDDELALLVALQGSSWETYRSAQGIPAGPPFAEAHRREQVVILATIERYVEGDGESEAGISVREFLTLETYYRKAKSHDPESRRLMQEWLGQGGPGETTMARSYQLLGLELDSKTPSHRNYRELGGAVEGE